jgi:aromatic ring-opening dioxygenase catalytic subunit (LigB family)
MMLGEASSSASYWKACGDAALAANIKGVIMMGAHWDSVGENTLEVATNPTPAKSPVAYVHPSKYVDYKLNPDMHTANRVIDILNASGFKAKGNDKFDWIHDTYLILIRMFPGGCPPTTLISMNARFDPHMHMRVGSAVAPLRNEGYLVIGTTSTATSGAPCCSTETVSHSPRLPRAGRWSSGRVLRMCSGIAKGRRSGGG